MGRHVSVGAFLSSFVPFLAFPSLIFFVPSFGFTLEVFGDFSINSYSLLFVTNVSFLSLRRERLDSSILLADITGVAAGKTTAVFGRYPGQEKWERGRLVAVFDLPPLCVCVDCTFSYPSELCTSGLRASYRFWFHLTLIRIVLSISLSSLPTLQ